MTEKEAIEKIKNKKTDNELQYFEYKRTHEKEDSFTKAFADEAELYIKILNLLEEKNHKIKQLEAINKLMAKYISELDIDEDICKYQVQSKDCGINEKNKCIKCVADYFIKKAEED